MMLSFKGCHCLSDRWLFVNHRYAYHRYNQYEAQQERQHHEVWPEVRLRPPQIEDAHDETEGRACGEDEVGSSGGSTRLKDT